MNQYNNDPLNYPAGTEFDYSVWEPGTVISLCNVPWDSTYRDTVMFGADNATPVQRRTALNSYIDSLETPQSVMPGGMPVRVDVPVRVGLSHNKAQRYNYLRARNPILPTGANPTGDVQKDYYYFILGARYINPGTTELTLQLDVFQTFIYETTFGNCYIERGHVGIANSRQFDNYGRDYLTVPEGIDTGGEYRIVTTKTEKIDAYLNFQGQQARMPYNVLICSTVDLAADPGDADNPKLATAEGGTFSNMASGASYYVLINQRSLVEFMKAWKERPWVTQGIISITLIPPITRYVPSFDFSDEGVGYVPSQAKASIPPENMRVTLGHDMLTNWRNSPEILNAIPERYRHLRKLFTFPYMAIELTTYQATPLILRPELWNSANAHIAERAALIPPNQRVVFYPRWYNTENTSSNLQSDDDGEYYDMMTQISSFPSVALVNNSHIGYLASNRASINNQFSAAEWSQTRSMRGADTGYSNSMQGIRVGAQLTDLQNSTSENSLSIQQSLEQQNWLLNSLGGIGMGAGMGAMAGPAGSAVGAVAGVAGAAMSGLAMGNSQGAAQRQLGLQQGANSGANQINSDSAASVANSNRHLSNWSARGDYEQTIAAIDARVQDTKLLQPSVSGQTGGETLHTIYDTMQIAARWKMIDRSALATVCEHWLQFGYAVHRRYTPPASLQVMSKFTYWKMTQAQIRSTPIPEAMKNIIRGIFEKGVTVYRSPNDIGIVDPATNTPIAGVSL